MPEYENNHYVPQLILRRFGNKINLYNVKTGEVKFKRSTLNMFNEKNLYPKELEKKLSLFESKIANLLDKKILVETNEISLTRTEIWQLVQYACISMIRTPNAFNRLKLEQEDKVKLEKQGFKEFYIENETDEEYSERTIDVILDSKNIKEVYEHPKVTYEACKWASLFNYSCLSILDSKDAKEDFVIMDVGMICEHDKTRFQPFPSLFSKEFVSREMQPIDYYRCNEIEEILKHGYIYSILYPYTEKVIKKEEITNKEMNLIRAIYLTEEQMKYVHANYYIIPVSNTRTVSFINPFFKLYFDEELLSLTGCKPDIWPTTLSPETMKTGTCNYKKNNELSKDDIFIYPVKNIPYEDVIKINCMAIDRIDTWLGFDESSRICRTLNVYSLVNYQRNNYSPLIEEFKNMGYEFPKKQIFFDIKESITNPNFTKEELKYNEFFYKNVILPERAGIEIFNKKK